VFQAIQVQLPNGEVLANFSADFTCCVMIRVCLPLFLWSNYSRTLNLLGKSYWSLQYSTHLF